MQHGGKKGHAPTQPGTRSSPGLPEGETLVQRLWEGYGTVSSRTHSDGTAVIVKRVQPPVGATGASHVRKLRSYEVEAAFYTSGLPTQLCAAGVAVPRAVGPARPEEMVLTDLRPTYPVQRGKGCLSDHELRAGIELAARLHAATWQGRGWWSDVGARLWSHGTFYQLDSRLQEHTAAKAARMPLARLARAVDLRLLQQRVRRHTQAYCDREESADAAVTGWALLHGDLKAPNLFFCHHPDGRCTAAACDFQYTGPGCVLKDVAYLLCNSATDEQLDGGRDEQLVRHYVDCLAAARLRVCGNDQPAFSFERAWCEYELAVYDYARFMEAWAPARGREPRAYALRVAHGVYQRIVRAAAGVEGEADALAHSGIEDGPDGESVEQTRCGLDAAWAAFPATTLA